jgi:hypothetical protein
MAALQQLGVGVLSKAALAFSQPAQLLTPKPKRWVCRLLLVLAAAGGTHGRGAQVEMFCVGSEKHPAVAAGCVACRRVHRIGSRAVQAESRRPSDAARAQRGELRRGVYAAMACVSEDTWTFLGL